jgi:hypothetical protein
VTQDLRSRFRLEGLRLALLVAGSPLSRATLPEFTADFVVGPAVLFRAERLQAVPVDRLRKLPIC